MERGRLALAVFFLFGLFSTIVTIHDTSMYGTFIGVGLIGLGALIVIGTEDVK